MTVNSGGDRERLSGLGWSPEPFDTCWLDCDRAGHRREDARPGGSLREIVLCLPHALRLEDGVWAGSYAGAPLPPDSLAASWPWRELAA